MQAMVPTTSSLPERPLPPTTLPAPINPRYTNWTEEAGAMLESLIERIGNCVQFILNTICCCADLGELSFMPQVVPLTAREAIFKNAFYTDTAQIAALLQSDCGLPEAQARNSALLLFPILQEAARDFTSKIDPNSPVPTFVLTKLLCGTESLHGESGRPVVEGINFALAARNYPYNPRSHFFPTAPRMSQTLEHLFDPPTWAVKDHRTVLNGEPQIITNWMLCFHLKNPSPEILQIHQAESTRLSSLIERFPPGFLLEEAILPPSFEPETPPTRPATPPAASATASAAVNTTAAARAAPSLPPPSTPGFNPVLCPQAATLITQLLTETANLGPSLHFMSDVNRLTKIGEELENEDLQINGILNFLGFIYSEPSLRQHFKAIYDSSLKGTLFVRNLSNGFVKSMNANHLLPYISEFAALIGTNPHRLRMLAEGGNWAAFLKEFRDRIEVATRADIAAARATTATGTTRR